MENCIKKPWQGIGVDVDGNLSSREMLYKAKLDWEVSKIPSQRPKSYGNQETLRFFKGFFEAVNAEIESVGSLDGARILWSLARLKGNFTLNNDDLVKNYILLASRDEGREKIEVKFLAVRENGHNMLPVISKAKPHIKNIFRRTFKTNFPFLNQKLQKFDDEETAKVKEYGDHGHQALPEFAEKAMNLASKKVDESTAWRFMLGIFQPETTKDVSIFEIDELKKLAEKNTKLAMEAFSKAPGQDLKSTSKTAWGLLNAVTYTIDYRIGKNQDSRLRQAWFGANAKLKKRALDLTLEL